MKNTTYKTILTVMLVAFGFAAINTAEARRPRPGQSGGAPAPADPGTRNGTTVTTAAKPGSPR